MVNINGAAAVENSLVIPQKAKLKITIRSSNSTPRYIPKKAEKEELKEITYSSMFIAAFLISQRCKQFRCSSAYEWINKT